MPYLIASIATITYKETVCRNPVNIWSGGPVGFWVMLFIFSKIPELVDTVFIILRKRNLIFLHWYHHVTVLLFCWNAYATTAGSGLYFVAMNYSVHALMYLYYCLQALKMVPKNFPSILITVAQIIQMIIGIAVCGSQWYYRLSNQPCHFDNINLIMGSIIYGSYLYLFLSFAFGKYLFNSSSSSSTQKLSLKSKPI
jgi:hypothetical protein